MNTTNLTGFRNSFGEHAEGHGRIPTVCRVTGANALGLDATSVHENLAEEIGHGARNGRIDGSAIAALVKEIVVATPGGGLRATGTEDVKYKPAFDNEQLFMGRQDIKPPSGPS